MAGCGGFGEAGFFVGAAFIAVAAFIGMPVPGLKGCVKDICIEGGCKVP